MARAAAGEVNAADAPFGKRAIETPAAIFSTTRAFRRDAARQSSKLRWQPATICG
jgi:hypothetical protein